ncbi:MAG: rod shape-determining protein MreD [Bacteroidota bacterium]|nr:rod shape-determining protein MreD [Bacteroidota bacterium]
MKQFIRHLLWFVCLLLIQVLLLDNMHFLGVFIPLIYIYGLLRLPSEQSTASVIFIGFLVGLAMDMLTNTPGLHASATTLMAFLRYPVLRLFVLKEDMSSRDVSVGWLGKSAYWKYCLVLVLIHHTMVFLLEALSFFNIGELLLKIAVCSLLTIIFIFAMELINRGEHARNA